MRHWLLPLAAVLAVGSPAAHAQTSRDIITPGYVVIRVILDGVAVPNDGSVPGGPPGSSGPPGGSSDGGGIPGSGPPGSGPPGAMAPGGGRPPADAKSIFVVAPYTSIRFKPLYPDKAPNGTTNPTYAAMKTKYGVTYLYSDNTSIQVQPIREPSGKGALMPSYETPIREGHRKWGLNRTFEPIYQLTIDALALGMVDQAFEYADETVKLVDVLKDKTPPTKVQEFVKLWRTLSPKLERAATPSPEADEWRSRLSAANVKVGKHYSLVYWGERQINPTELDRRLAALDRNFKAFYLWHALQGISLKVPDKTLTVLLADRSTDVFPLKEKLDGLPIQSDAFYSPIHNLLVLSPERLDVLGAGFADLAKASYKNGWSRDELVKGVPHTGGPKQPPIEITRMMTLALVDRLLEEEMDNSAVSREATRQLYVASGMLPQNVQLPHWLESGLGSLLQHPKGPLFSKDDKGHTAMVAGLAYGYGSPNYILHRQYRELDAKRELNPKPEVLLKNVLTDRYFDAVKAGADVDPPPEKPAAETGVPVGGSGVRPMPGSGPPGSGPPGESGPVGRSPGGPPGSGPPGSEPPGGTITMENEIGNKRMLKEKLYKKAEVTSWALVYYLSRDRVPGVQRFYAELRRMPRDMRLDENFILMTFCRCFNLMDKLKPNEIDQNAFKDFADKWVRAMKIVPPYGMDVPFEADGGHNGPTGPMGPMGPGGLRPPGS